MKKVALAFAVLSLLAVPASVEAAAPCKDAKGKFIKCPPPKPAPPKPAPCKDAKGKFIKCPPPKSAPCKDAKGKFIKCPK